MRRRARTTKMAATLASALLADRLEHGEKIPELTELFAIPA